MQGNERPEIALPIAAKGHRQQFFSDPAIDKIHTMLIALMAEVSALRDRLDAHERLAARGIVATPEAVDGYLPEPEIEAEREKAREDYVNRMFRVLREEAERFTRRDDPDWENTVKDVRDDDN